MKSNLKVLLLLLTAVIILVGYAFLTRDSASGSLPASLDISSLEKKVCHVSDSLPSTIESMDSSVLKKADIRKRQLVDTLPKNILFIGDSMLEGLTRRFIDYADENGHQLHTVIWYSSTSEAWATTDVLKTYMEKYKPDYIVVCLCGNELFVKDIPRREKWLRQIVERFGDIPFVWISPPNWKKDTGINEAIIRVVGKDRYFDSTHLTLERKSDHAHPTYPAAAKWMDLVAEWMQSDKVRNPIRMKTPTMDVGPRNVVMLQPWGQ